MLLLKPKPHQSNKGINKIMKQIRLMSVIIIGLMGTAGCDQKSELGISEFDLFYIEASTGKNINCDKLVQTIGWVEASSHMQSAHGETLYPVHMHDYMILTDNDFTELGVCANEIEQARVDLCDEASKLVTEVNKKNDALKSTGGKGGMVYGYSLSQAQFEYCKNLKINKTPLSNEDKLSGILQHESRLE